jgi:hypothetical protein
VHAGGKLLTTVSYLFPAEDLMWVPITKAGIQKATIVEAGDFPSSRAPKRASQRKFSL